MQQCLHVCTSSLVLVNYKKTQKYKIPKKSYQKIFCWVKGNHAQSMLSIKMQVESGDNAFTNTNCRLMKCIWMRIRYREY